MRILHEVVIFFLQHLDAILQHFRHHISRGTVQYEDVYRRTVEILQCSRILRANYCLMVHNA